VKFLQGQGGQEATVSLTPLVDIIFLLIIFFLVSSTFEKGEQKLGIELPSTKGGQASKDSGESWVLLVDQRGRFFWNDSELKLSELESRLRRNKGRKDKVQVVVKADGRVAYEKVASVLGLLNEFEYRKVAFKTLELVDDQ
jgi:biopolymer transport protein ExbD